MNRLLLTLYIWISLKLYENIWCQFNYNLLYLLIQYIGVLDTTLCDKICQWLATGWCFFPGIPVSSSNKTDRPDITEIVMKVALNPLYIYIATCINVFKVLDITLSPEGMINKRCPRVKIWVLVHAHVVQLILQSWF